MRSEIFDLIPGGGPALAGIHDRRSLFKGAKAPDDPPPVTAPVKANPDVEGDAARSASRKKGIQKTILSGESALQPTLGAKTKLGANAGFTMPAYGGEP